MNAFYDLFQLIWLIPVEKVIGFDVENFFRDIDVDDVKQLYRKGDQHLTVESSSPKRAVPRSKSFYYAFQILHISSIYLYNMD